MKITLEEAIKEFESELEWAELNIYPYISKQKIEADKMAIKALEQKPKTGHWINYKDEHQCSNCRETIIISPEYWEDNEYDYCPYCGAKMVEPQESEDKE